jgi:YhgE/Pip-like protein
MREGREPSRQEPNPPRVRASGVLRVRSAWLLPMVLAGVVVFLMTLIYFGSIVDPAAHLSGLPVLVVDQDRGAHVDGHFEDLGPKVVAGLTGSREVTSRLRLTRVSWSEARGRMDMGSDYATLVIPSNFTTSLLTLAGLHPTGGPSPGEPVIRDESNQRLGSIGTSLASDVLQPAVAHASHTIGNKLSSIAASSHPNEVVKAVIADPVTFSVVEYRPLPQHSALGLSAFYISLLALMCGFVGATIVNSSLDSALGYASTEVGPRWSQRRPVSIGRWQTLLSKWAVAAVLMPVLTGLLVLGAVGILGMDAPDPVTLWLFTALAAISVAAGTLVLFAALGTPGQLIALLIFVYLALASSGGTVPIQALPGAFRFVSHVEPLRQILDGNRALLYFGGKLDAGLEHALIVMVVELAIWVAIGIAVTIWYDRREFQRMTPEMLDYVNRSIDRYLETRPTVTEAPAAEDMSAASGSLPSE